MKSNYCTTWASSQYLTESFNMPEISLNNTTVRQIIHTSIGGKSIRIRFSNTVGNGPIKIKAVTIAKNAKQGSGKIIVSTLKEVLFNNKPEVLIPVGEEIYSDTFDFCFNALEELSVSIYFEEVPEQLTGHPGSRTNTFFESGNQINKEAFCQDNKTAHWYVISAIDVLDNEKINCNIVCLGDSITDGRGSTDDLQNRWTDNLAALLQKDFSTANIGVINEGIGGTCITSSGVNRFTHDVLETPGIKYLIILYGINDIIYANKTADHIINTYKDFIKKAHDRNIKVLGGTILPFGNCHDYTPEKNAIRHEVNNWIRNSVNSKEGFDSLLDFDIVMSDSNNKEVIAKDYDCGDGLHPSAKGYEQMIRAFNDLIFFKKDL